MDDASLCTQCGAALPPQARFCPQCGARVAEAPAASAPSGLPSGERRQVAILFADLSGYTHLSQTQDPEETHRLLTRFFELVDDVIERLGGSIDKHIGDAVMGVFGAPVAYGNDVERALRAAVAIHEGMITLSAEAKAALGTHIGIASGEVVAAATGSAARHDYTVTGDAVNLAARLTDLARRGETVVSDDVHRASLAFAEMSPLGNVTIRGIPQPVRAWKLRALHATSRDAQPLVGRDAERRRFAALVAALERDRVGAVALIRADPGMGKSRLAETLLADARVAGAQCHAAAVLDFGVARGHDAIQSLLCSLLDSAASDEAGRDEALRRAVEAGRAAAEDEQYLADLLLVPRPRGGLYDAVDAETRRSGKLRALADVVERAAHICPCVLLVDDVHWAGEWVLACLQALADVTARAPILLTMSTRRDGDPIGERWSRERITRFDLAPLDRDAALALAHAQLAATPDLAERCVERAQGNPLFLMQLLREGSDATAIPPTIQSVVLARLDRLTPKDKSAMQAAAVIGLHFPLDLLRHLVDDPGYVPDAPRARDLLRTDDRDDRFMMFTHALIRDGAYASLLHAARRALHSKAAGWYGARDPALRAGHLERAEDPLAAEAYLAAARGEVAAMRIESALALAERGGALAAAVETRYALWALVGELHADLARADESIAAWQRALAAAQTERERTLAWIGIASAHRLQTTVAQGLAALDAAEAHAGAPELVKERARIAYLRGNLHFASGNAEACRLHHERALSLARDAGDAELEAHALSGLADALYAQGRLRSAYAAFTRCLEICDARGFTRFALMNECMVAIGDALLGRLDDAVARVTRTRAIARDVRFLLAETMCEESIAWSLVFAGRPHDALEWVMRGLPLARATGARRFEVVLLASLARIRRHEGALDEARARINEAWALSEKVGARFAGPLVLGEVATLAETSEDRHRALADGERLLADECLSHCHLGFYQAAIDVALGERDWPSAERYAQALADYMRDEPQPLIDFLVARGRALAAAGRGQHDVAALAALRERALAWKLPAYLQAIDAALKA